MIKWHSQRYINKARNIHTPEEVIKNAVSVAENVIEYNKAALPIFTLGHLSKQIGSKQDTLDTLVKRQRIISDSPNYKVFSINKKKSTTSECIEKRFICVPCNELYNVQRFINQNILIYLNSHNAVVSYTKGCTLYDAALPHCESKWLIKVDLKDFFDSINEVHVYRIFRKIGYSSLLAFQMARLCTRVIPKKQNNISNLVNKSKEYSLKEYNNKFNGSLPQGAPTSPILSNLAGYSMDTDIENLSKEYNITYTRYSDDLFLSTTNEKLDRISCQKIVFRLYEILKFHGFEPNLAKTKIIPPGARKIVLGLIVNGEEPKLAKDFKSNLLQHLHFCNLVEVGPVKHARHKNFDSIIGFRNHLKGLVSYALQIDLKFGNKALLKFKKIKWPI